MRARFHISGHPAPKGSRTSGVRKDGTRFSRESSKRTGPWVEAVARKAQAHRLGGKPLEPPYEIRLHFSMPEPAKPKYPWPTRDGDADKLARGVLDGLTKGGLLLDDRHVTILTASKQFAPLALAGVTVEVR